jgi:hypothetical protein
LRDLLGALGLEDCGRGEVALEGREVRVVAVGEFVGAADEDLRGGEFGLQGFDGQCDGHGGEVVLVLLGRGKEMEQVDWKMPG